MVPKAKRQGVLRQSGLSMCKEAGNTEAEWCLHGQRGMEGRVVLACIANQVTWYGCLHIIDYKMA